MEFNQSDFLNLILNGMTWTSFVAYYCVAMVGVLFFFVSTVYEAVKYNNSTPKKFNWKYMLKTSGLRIVLVAIALFFVVTQFDMFRGEDISIGGAFIAGVGVDGVIKSILGMGKSFTNK